MKLLLTTLLVLLIVSMMVAMSACTHIENLNVLTVATNCDVLRETEKATEGSGNAGVDVVTRRGDASAAAAMASAFTSSVYCKKDVIAADARVAPAVEEVE